MTLSRATACTRRTLKEVARVVFGRARGLSASGSSVSPPVEGDGPLGVVRTARCTWAPRVPLFALGRVDSLNEASSWSRKGVEKSVVTP